MKTLLKAIKYIHHFLNHEVKPQDEAYDILQFMLLRASTTHSMEIMESLEEQFKAEMMKRKAEAEKVCRAINAKWIPEPVKLERKPYTYDPNYDKSLNELNATFSA